MAGHTLQTHLAGQDRVSRYRTTALHALAALAAGDRRPKTLHRLRTHLRRLQAYLELVGEEDSAAIIARSVSRFSRLRTLHVFDQYLDRFDAPGRDRRLVTQRIRAVEGKLKKKRTYRKVECMVERHALPPTPAPSDWMGRHLIALRHRHADRLRKLIAQASADPRRKTLHRLRLMIKSIRYQEEWALDAPYARPDLVAWLKQAQTVLGEYEELAQFRKLAAKLRLKSQALIAQDWRRARDRARAMPAHLHERIGTLTGRHLRLLRTR
ncbi:MAG: CHAD domain-containing protein [Nitrospirota bacterium]|nr:CHAD domain-containing protein [Nitrospirota bacterium]MDE3241336.1 CHAD domain-containing protein [Nitrospirota bacterium]